MKKVLIIVGPTAVGKTELSIELAKRFNGEIISGDSIQVYKGLDIGSAKISDEEREGIVHYGIDILSPFDSYSVWDFQKLARNKIEEISGKNKLPMIVGGTGLYIKACIYDYVFNEDSYDEAIAGELEKKSSKELYEELLSIDTISGNKIHPNNRKRIIRALLIAKSGRIKSEIENSQMHREMYDAFIVGCTLDRPALYERINNRVSLMCKEGLKKEIKGLLELGVSFDNRSMQGIGYKEWRDYFANKLSEEETVSLIQKHTRNFAKRQYTWFNNQMNVNWVDMNNKEEIAYLIDRIEEWYGQKT